MYYYETRRYESHFIKPEYLFSVSLPNKNPLKEYLHEGQRYVEGRKGTEYVLRFTNNSSSRVLAVMSVDGLSIMDGKPAGVGSNGYVVGPRQTVEVPGWRIDDGTVAKFVFRPQGDSQNQTYVEALRSEGVEVDASNQGVIGCLVFREREREVYTSGRIRGIPMSAKLDHLSDPYNGLPRGAIAKSGVLRSTSTENFSYNSSSQPSGINQFVNSISPTHDWHSIEAQSATTSSVGTGFGEDTSFKTQNVKFERANNYQPDETIVLMYDTLAGLRKRGVPVDPVKNPVENAFPNSPYLAKDGCRVPKRR